MISPRISTHVYLLLYDLLHLSIMRCINHINNTLLGGVNERFKSSFSFKSPPIIFLLFIIFILLDRGRSVELHVISSVAKLERVRVMKCRSHLAYK